MKKIFMVLFLILVFSTPAFAKKQQIEPDWMPFMTAKDGTEWYYDINSIKNKWGTVRSYYIEIKNTKDGISKTDKYLVSCSYKGWKPSDPAWRAQPWISKNKPFKIENYKEGYLSGYLINKICDVK